MITQLTSLICLALAQTSAPKQLLYKAEIIDSNGTISKPIIRTLEKNAAEIDVTSSENSGFKMKLTPGNVDGRHLNNSIEITFDTPLIDENGKTIGKNERVLRMDTTVQLGKTIVWDVKENNIVSSKMPKNHKAKKGEILISLDVDVVKDGP